MTTIYLIRHAEAEGNLHRRIHGWYDALITENGFAQIKALENRFRDIHIDAVWSSDLYRTCTTARAIYVPKGLPLHTDPQLREINLGDWEDQTWGQVRHFDPAGMAAFNRSDPAWRAPGGESLAEAGDRLERALTSLARQHPGQTVAVFSHGTAIRQFLANVKGISPEDWHTLSHSENTAVNCLTFDGERFQVVFDSDASHLPPELATLGKQAWWRKDKQKAEDVNLWFRPIRWDTERELYLGARRDARESTGTLYSADPEPRRSNKVVNIHTTTQLQVVLVKPDRFENAAEIADHLREKRTVVLNLEQTNKDIARRLLDFLSGVAYANEGKIKKVAISTYIITPYNVDILGDLIDELENNGLYF